MQDQVKIIDEEEGKNATLLCFVEFTYANFNILYLNTSNWITTLIPVIKRKKWKAV